jgi:hypothetical protein
MVGAAASSPTYSGGTVQQLRSVIRDAGGSNPRLALAAVRVLENDLDWLRRRAVRLARQSGYDWGTIGRLLGRTRQSVRERFADDTAPLDPLPPHARGLSDTDEYYRRLFERCADHRRRREFEGAPEGDEVVPW